MCSDTFCFYGGYPGYLSLMIKSFNRSDEDAWLVGASYDFERIGAPGLSSFVNYARGNTPDSGSTATPDQREVDITVDYRFQSELLKGLWLRARAAFVDQDNDVAGAIDSLEDHFGSSRLAISNYKQRPNDRNRPGHSA